MNRLILIDGHNLFHRAYWGLKRQDLRSKNGTPTWGIHGFFTSVAGVIKRYEPSHVLVAFDQGDSTKRLQIYPDYKLQRRNTTHLTEDHSIPDQMESIIKLLDLFGICVHREFGVEADDIIATCTKRFEDAVDEILIVSGDHDLLQLVTPWKVKVLKPSLGGKSNVKEEYFDSKAVLEKYGLPAEALPQVWALTGDPGDGVPGVPGIGEKTAVKLIKQYTTASNVCLSNEKKVAGHEHTVRQALRLVELDDSIAQCNFKLESLEWNPTPPNVDELYYRPLEEFLESLELESLRTRWVTETLWTESTVTHQKLA